MISLLAKPRGADELKQRRWATLPAVSNKIEKSFQMFTGNKSPCVLEATALRQLQGRCRSPSTEILCLR